MNFFTQCKRTESEKELFGLCDDSSEREKQPAYIDDIRSTDKWIAEVHNHRLKHIDFYAIDGCVKWMREDKNPENVCDGMLAYKNNRNLIFVELKDRNPANSQWRIKGEQQLKSTIKYFQTQHDTNGVNIKAYLCNRKSLFDEGNEEYLQRFKDDTHVTLRISREIEII